MKKGVSIIAVSLVALAAVSCHKESAKLQGRFLGAGNKKIYLERVTPAYTSVADSVLANEKGEFGFRLNMEDRQPTIFNLRYEGDMIPMLISPGEKVKISSYSDVSRSYRVTGSQESELVGRLHGILTNGTAALDSISNLYMQSRPDDLRRQQFTQAYYDVYYKTKREHVRFITENAGSLAAVYALYQRLPGEDVLFNGESDYVYYQMVADSVKKNYPDSRYVIALEKEVEAGKAQRELAGRLISEGIKTADFPDVELPDMYGEKKKLSSFAGNVIILDFWSVVMPDSGINNADMKELYAEFKDKGLSIYQVSLDSSKSVWVTAVQEQKLPWVTVCDFRGDNTVAVKLYNVKEIPTNYIIDRQGNIVAKNLFGDALGEKIRELL